MKIILNLFCLFISTILFITDPFKIGSNIHWLHVLYLLPLFVIPLSPNQKLKKRGLFDEPKYLNMLKSITLLIGYLIAAGVELPFITQILETINIFISQWDNIGEAANLIIGLYISIKAIFSDTNSTLGNIAKKLEPSKNTIRERNI